MLAYVLIANRDDGAQKILLIKDAAKLCQHIRVGDYLEAEGEKQSEELFHAAIAAQILNTLDLPNRRRLQIIDSPLIGSWYRDAVGGRSPLLAIDLIPALGAVMHVLFDEGLRLANVSSMAVVAGGQLFALRVIVPAMRDLSPRESARLHQVMLVDIRTTASLFVLSCYVVSGLVR